MSSKYSVIKQENQKYNICAIKIENGKKCVFWNIKDDKVFKDIIAIFNNENRVELNNNQIVLSFHGITDREDINNLMIAFGTEVYKNGLDITKVKFKFIVDSKDEEEISNDFIKRFRLDGIITHSDKYTQLTENLEDAINKIASMSADETPKEDNLELKKNDVNENKIYSNNDLLSFDDKKRLLLSEWRKDPVKSREIYNLSREALDKMLTDAVNDTMNVNDNSENESSKEEKKISDEVLSKYPPISNTKDRIFVSRPQPVIKKTVENDSGVDSSFWDEDNMLGSLTDNELPIYYVDDESKRIYNEENKFIGSEGVGGLEITDDNNLVSVYNNTVIGQVKDVNEMKPNRSKSRVYKPNKKIDYSRGNKSAAFISLPVIIFILSLLLLVVSGIILYLMK